MKAKSIFSVLVGLSAMIMSCFIFAACAPTDTEELPNTGNYEFVFEGSSSEFSGGRTYDITIYGENDGTISMSVEQLPLARLSGEWKYVENKGYKIYPADSAGTIIYTAYDAAAGDHSFNYSISLGTGYGTAKVNFTYHDAEFADIYDGEGLGKAPPIFEGVGWWGWSNSKYPTGQTEFDLKLICQEDGSVVWDWLVAGAKGQSHAILSTATWEYDAENDAYIIDVSNATYGSGFLRNWDDGSDLYLHFLAEKGEYTTHSEPIDIAKTYTVTPDANGVYTFEITLIGTVYTDFIMSYAG